MREKANPRNLLSALFFQANSELLQLMDGFYSNIEDGLFELAYGNDNQAQQRHIIELMRELRFRRQHLINTFSKRMQTAAHNWWEQTADATEYLVERELACAMASKCTAHFGTLLQSVAERVTHAMGARVSRQDLPISPEAVSYHFILSCRSVDFDEYSIDTVKNLFQRFVLDRLGTIYGMLNQQLADSGFCTDHELEDLTLTHSA